MKGPKSIRAGLAFAAATVIKLLSGLIIIRLISRKIGVDGLGQLGQLMSVMGIITLLAGGGIFTGLIKYVAEYREEKLELKRYLRAGSLIGAIACILLGAALFLLAGDISQFLFGSKKFIQIIYVLSVFQILIGANNFCVSIINGHQDVVGFAAININGSLLGVGIVYFLTSRFGLQGAMVGIILAPAMLGLFSIPYTFHKKLLTIDLIRPKFDKIVSTRLLGYSGMLIITAITLPVAQIVVRKMIVAQYGWSAVGYWQGVNRVSDAYLQFVTVVLANYYLPELASAPSLDEMKKRVFSCFRIAVPTTIAMAMIIYLLKGFVIRFVFAPSFAPMKSFFLFQIIGDCLKVCSQVIGYVAVAKAMTSVYVGLEILQSVLFIGISYLCLKYGGPVGVTYAYAITFVFQLGILMVLFRSYLSPSSKFYNYKV